MAALVQSLRATLSLAMARRNKFAHRSTPSLRRGKSRREPRRRFLLFCEGENTERVYFEAIKRLCQSALINIEIFAEGNVPYTLAEKAVKCAKKEGLVPGSRRKKNSFEKNDEIWVVFDRDEHPRFEEAIALCENHGIKIGRSNPCFEVWLILHIECYDQYRPRNQVQALLSKLRPEYNKSGAKKVDCDELVKHVERAEERASLQLRSREREDDKFGNPSTTVGLLTYAIRKADKLARL